MRSTWTVDPNTLAALRLGEAEKAALQGDLDRSLIEAEELLDEDPSHHRALELVAEAALGMGDVVMALEALNRIMELHTPGPRILHALSVARFQAVDYPGALASAEQATSLDPGQAASWHYQGLALERMAKTKQAQVRFKRAAALDPEHFEVQPPWDDIDWDKLLGAALDQLTQPMQVFFDGVPIRFLDYPAIEDLLENYPPLSPFTDALYRGQSPAEGDPWITRPDHVSLFRGNLSRPVRDEDEITKRIAEALTHEAMHWLGIQEAD